MVTIAVTGHMNLTAESVAPIRRAVRGLLTDLRGEALVGRSCLARGADTLFAEEVLAAGGSLSVIIPSKDYRDVVVTPGDLGTFDALCDAADELVTMPFAHAGPDAYEAANRRMLDGADRLVAVWDGLMPANGAGGTADTVAIARSSGMAVDIVWPARARRTP